ncbi:four-carbon acid sugar kinase family protein [Vogesella sp. DC21W]|uniref:Four-carbon acid sugar kinase family protein n=1 Tax=Vogesella aquatica TaxID=2984206 RepID=A0ABT5IVI8_9NEIS|nr:four-carbon acid sugar kinase family protein [Vogesella aquatica]MDC7716580.1 four-carbon acid sugar kinase family protein [Vogesella aquatica]
MDTKQNLQISVLADDLTSAADGAAPFVEAGFRATLGRGQLPSRLASVVTVDSGARSASPQDAAAMVAHLTRQLAPRPLLYKTVDSTLRGHVTVELEACFKASGRKTVVFAPAFPAAGRTTIGGIQYVDGVPVAESVYGCDPVHPAQHSALAALLPDCIPHAILLDACTQDELDAQVAAVADPESVLWVGSPGMAIALAKRFAPKQATPQVTPFIPGDPLVVIGSANPRSQQQADYLQQRTGVALLRAPGLRLSNPIEVLQHLAQAAAQTLSDPRFGALMVSGGDTMAAILDHLDIQEFEVLQELAPGFPLGHAMLPQGRTLLLAMKAGGFGGDDALEHALKQLQCLTSSSRKDHS